MFESIVASILNRFLGSYVDNFDSKLLNIGIWSGDVRLKNLTLKKESLDKFKLPLDVKFGHLGELTLQIPWSNLKGKPVRIIIEDVYLLASPMILAEYDALEDQKREQQLKQDKLKDLEAIQSAVNSNLLPSDDPAANESFTESLVTKIVDNLQVTIKNIHVRYEDEGVLTESPYALGFTLAELSATSTDENWKTSFISITQELTRKLVSLRSFACYMNTESSSIFSHDPAETLKALKDFFTLDQQCQYLLKPVSGEGHLLIHKTGATKAHPHVSAELFFEEFGIDFDSSQYRDILWTASKFHWYQKTWKFRKLRPKLPVQEAPRDWMKYAAESVLKEIHDKNYKWSWAHFKKRRDQRVAYIELWTQKLLKRVLSPQDEKRFKELEEDLSYEDIKFYRSLTRSEIRKKNIVAPTTVQTEQKSSGGWFGWWGQKPEPTQAPSDEGSLDLKLTDEQRKALYDTIDYNENQPLDINIPRDRVTMEAFVTLKRAGISLKPNKGAPALAEVVVEGCTAQYYQRPDSFLANFQLQELKVEDGTAKTLYKHVVSVKHVHSDLHHGETSLTKTSLDPKSDPFFQVSFENNPLDGKADSALLAKLKSMTIFYNCYFIEEIIKFFKPPKIHLDTVGAIMNAAEATMEGLTSQTRLGLQYALEEHKTINLKLDLQAPLVILPLDPTNWKSPVAILDAGHISVKSDLVDKKIIQEMKGKDSYDKEDWSKLNTLMYDQFNLHLQDAQFLVGPTIKSTMEQLHTQTSKQSANVLDNLDVKLSFGVSILPDATNLARFKLGGEIPNVNISLNDFQYKTLMQLIDVLVPKPEDGETEDDSVFDAFGSGGNTKEISDADHIREDKKNLLNTQHMFEMDFTIATVKLSLFRCIKAVSLETEPLIEIVGDSLALLFYSTETAMHLDLSLTDVNIFDHIEKSGIPEFEKLVSSNNFSKDDQVQKVKHELFKLTYDRTTRIVEHKGSEIEVFDQDIVLDMSALKCVVSRKSYLSLLNFALNTFTETDVPETPADELKHNDSTDDSVAPQRINVTVNLDSFIVVLNEDGIKLTTLQLSTALIDVFVLPEQLEVKGKLGALTLHDETNQGSPRNSIFRSLISIEGDNLAEFVYKTYDLETNKEEYQSSIEFHSAAMKINFVEDAFGKIFAYLNKFQKMKAIYDSAREAAINQASQIEGTAKIKMDFLVKAPTIYFPKLNVPENENCDMLIAQLGELYLSNVFENKSDAVHNLITAGIRNVQLSTEFYFDEDVKQVGKIVDDLDIGFHIDYVEDFHPDIPTCLVEGKLPEVNMKLTELQLRYIYNLQNSIMKIFETIDDEDAMEDIEVDADNANAVIKHSTMQKEAKPSTDSQKKIEEVKDLQKSDAPTEDHPDHKQLGLKFDVPGVSLTLYNDTGKLADFESRKLVSLAINDLSTTFDMRKDGHFSSELSLTSITVNDVREGAENKFHEILPPIKGDKKQFILNLTTDKANSKSITAVLTIERPHLILALDLIFDLQSFADRGLQLEGPVKVSNDKDLIEDDDSSDDDTKIDEVLQEPAKFGFSLNIIDPSVILLADLTQATTEAVVFKVEQVLVTSQNIISLAANNIGMFMTKMDHFDDQRLRIIDDFSISFALDSKTLSEKAISTAIHLSVDPVLVRISLRDIRLAVKIFEKANAFYAKAQAGITEVSGDHDHNLSENFKSTITKHAPSLISSLSSNHGRRRKFSKSQEVISRAEEFNASIGGFRLVLIGDVHELPVIDMNLKQFDVKLTNWSSDLNSETHLETYVNIYNYSRSTWEPILDPWAIAVYASKVNDPKLCIKVDVVSREIAQISISARSVALLSQISSSITSEGPATPSEEVTPYRICNETGFEVEVWADNTATPESDRKVIKKSETINWAFEDWIKIRENLDTDNKLDVLSVKLVDSSYEEVHGINASGEGEEIFMLSPPREGVHNRLACQIELGSDNVKTIVLRSTVVVTNYAQTAIAVRMISDKGDNDIELVIEPEHSHALPINTVYNDKFKIKPLMNTKFNWSNESLSWRELMQGGTPLSCSTIGQGESSLYYFQAEAQFDLEEPLTRIYPHLNIVVSAPLEIENLLPFDLNFRLYDKSQKKDWSGSIKQGETSYVQVVTLKSLLLLSVEPLKCGFEKSEFAIINAVKGNVFKQETFMSVKSESGQQLMLRISYPKKQTSKTSLKVVIYSPYIVLNRTGLELDITENSRFRQIVSITQKGEENVPHMFSFDREGEKLNRALAKFAGCAWSAPLSFDAVGQSGGLLTQVSGKQLDLHFGVTTAEGEGKYQSTKVVTFAPRYIVKNSLKESILIVESGSTKQIEVDADQSTPLYYLRRGGRNTVALKFGRGGKWSSPFAIDDIGQTFLKVQKEGFGQVLLKVIVVTENATIFIQVEDANDYWPFSIRNFSETEFYIYQGNPNVNLNGEVVKDDVDYKPIYYKIPPKSVMPYAYDYPNAIVKDLIIRSRGRERAVNLAEIGNLKPFRLPQTENAEQLIVDLNVVADGPTQSLVITKYDPSVSLYKLQNESNVSTLASQQQFEVTEKDESYFKIVTRFEGFGLSIIDRRSKELCYTSLRGLELRYNESDLYQNLSLKVKWIQVDNQLFGGIFPIVIYPTVVPKSGKEMNEHPSFSAAVSRVKDDSHGVLFIKYATVLLQEMSIEVDEDFLFALIDFSNIPGASWNTEVVDKLCDTNLEIPEPKKLSEASDIYFEALHLQPTLLNLSFVRTERVNAEERSHSQNTLMFFVNILTMAIGNINDAPIKLNSLFIENIRVPIPVLLESITTHYGQAFFYQVYKILGSADFIGNPVGLFNNLSSGVIDIFYEPYQGFIMNDSPQELGIGIAKGGLSFLKKSVYGFSDSFAKMTGSLAKGLSVATMDRSFQEKRMLNMRRNRPKDALYGFSSGANSFFESVSSGITGIAQAPIQGASKDGAQGFFKGLGKGVIGFPTKTAIGLFDLASNVSEGIRNTTTMFDNDRLEKVRLPRYIPFDGVIRAYSQHDSQGQSWLKTVDGGEYINETFLAGLVLPGDEKAVIVTFNWIFLLNISPLKVTWKISLDRIKSISLESTGITIVLKDKDGPFLPIPDKNNKRMLYSKIKVAVDKYNTRCQVAL